MCALPIMVDFFFANEQKAEACRPCVADQSHAPERTLALASYIMCWSFMFSTGKRSTEIRTAVALPVFCHQCDVPFFSDATSPALCMIGTAQLLAYSTISPETM